MNNKLANARSDLALPELFAHSRKPAFHFGWDWAAQLTTCGITKPVYIRGYSIVKIVSTQFRNDPVTADMNLTSIRIFGYIEVSSIAPFTV